MYATFVLTHFIAGETVNSDGFFDWSILAYRYFHRKKLCGIIRKSIQPKIYI